MTGTVVYDADCGFCTRCADWLGAHGRSTIAPWQGLDLDAVGLTVEEVSAAVQYLDADGRPTHAGAAAVAAALRECRLHWRVLGHLSYAPPVRPLADLVYRWVADHRYRFPGGTAACRVDHLGGPGQPR